MGVMPFNTLPFKWGVCFHTLTSHVFKTVAVQTRPIEHTLKDHAVYTPARCFVEPYARCELGLALEHTRQYIEEFLMNRTMMLRSLVGLLVLLVQNAHPRKKKSPAALLVAQHFLLVP
jgi:hypothetical protein